MGDRIVRAWRAMRRPTTAPGGVAVVAARGDGFARPARRGLVRVDPSLHCGASGWQMRTGCSDGAGGTICPLCSQRVRTEPDAVARGGFEVIQAHCA